MFDVFEKIAEQFRASFVRVDPAHIHDEGVTKAELVPDTVGLYGIRNLRSDSDDNTGDVRVRRERVHQRLFLEGSCT
jgi:hypothetical protein